MLMISLDQKKWPDLSDGHPTFLFPYCFPDNSLPYTVIITLHWSVRSVFLSSFHGFSSAQLELHHLFRVDCDCMREGHLRVYVFPMN